MNLRLRYLGKWFGLPFLIYFVAFCVLTWPWMAHFGNYFFTDKGDGFQNVWNIWWIHQAVTQLHQLPWHTSVLHWPFGVTLIGQTLNPFNGFAALLLLPFIHLNQAYNVMVIFSFVMGGVTTFWLCHYFSKSYVASIIGGFIFTFSSFHFAHAEGHMQLVSLEWIPLFILLWWKFVKQPTYRLAVGAVVSLLLVLFCDYYYFLYSIMAAIGIVGYLWYRHEVTDVRAKANRGPFILLVGLGILLIAPLPVALLHANAHTQFTGFHDPYVFRTDALAPFIDGGVWHFWSLTAGYQRHITANIYESTVYVGLSVLTLLIIAVVRRKHFNRDITFWLGIIIVFGICSLGPRLLVAGHSLQAVPLPYTILERVIPGLKLSGMPVRMMVMVTLASAVIGSLVLAKLEWRKQTSAKLLLGLFLIVFFLEMWPRALPLSSATYQPYVYALQKLPAGAALDEAAASASIQLYNQTLTDKPMPFGYISRQPKYLDNLEFPLWADDVQNKLNLFCPDFKVRYLTTPANRPRTTTFPVVYHGKDAIIYDLKDSPKC